MIYSRRTRCYLLVSCTLKVNQSMKGIDLISTLKAFQEMKVIATKDKVYLPDNEIYIECLNDVELKKWMDKKCMFLKMSEVTEIWENLVVGEINNDINPFNVKLLEIQDYDLETIKIFIKHFPNDYKQLINWFSDCYNGNQPKKALNVYGQSNIGKSHFLQQILNLMNYTSGDLSNDDWITDILSINTQVIAFNDKVGNIMNLRKLEIMKRMLQGRENLFLLNTKYGAKRTVRQRAGWLLQSQVPLRLYMPEEFETRVYAAFHGRINRETLNEEELTHLGDLEAWEQRLYAVEFKESGLNDKQLDKNTLYSLLVKGWKTT